MPLHGPENIFRLFLNSTSCAYRFRGYRSHNTGCWGKGRRIVGYRWNHICWGLLCQICLYKSLKGKISALGILTRPSPRHWMTPWKCWALSARKLRTHGTFHHLQLSARSTQFANGCYCLKNYWSHLILRTSLLAGWDTGPLHLL